MVYSDSHRSQKKQVANLTKNCHQQFYEFCLSKKGVTEHFPFDEETLVLKVGGKMFVLSSLKEWEKGTPSVNVKCNPERAEQLREEYQSIKPGYHMSKVHWNTVSFHGDVPDKLICEMITDSYNLVFKTLPKKTQEKIV